MNDLRTDVSVGKANRAYDDEVTLAQLMQVVWRYRVVLLAVTLAAGVLALLVGWKRTPTYEATSKLLVNLPTDDRQGDESVRMGTYQALVSNQSLILKTMEELGLTVPPHQLSASEALGRNILVQPFADTRMILVTTRLADPALAANFANRLAERSVDLARQVAQEDSIAVRETIKVQLEESERRLDEAERRLEAFRKEAQLEALTAEVDALVQERARLLPLLVQIEAERARIRKTEQELARHEPVRDIPRSVSPALVPREPPQTREAAGREPSVSGRRPLARERAAPKRPVSRESSLTKRAAQVEEPLALTFRDDVLNPFINPVYEILNQQLSASRTRLSQLESERAEILRRTDLTKAGASQLNELYTRQAGLERLQRATKVARKVYVDVSTRYERARLQAAGRSAPMQILDRAIPPERPLAPRILRDSALAALVALIVATAGVLLYAGLTGKMNVM